MGILDDYEIDEEVKTKIEEAFKSETTGLVNKNAELLGKLKKEQGAKREFEASNRDILDKLGIDTYDELDDVLNQKKGDANDGKKTELELRKLQRQLEETAKEKEAVFSQLSNSQINNQIKSEFLKAGVKPEMVDALSLSFINQNKFELVKDDSGRFSAMNTNGNSPVEAVTEWAKSEESKIWRSAPINSGGGAQGSGSSGKAKLSMDQISQMTDQKARQSALKENGYLK